MYSLNVALCQHPILCICVSNYLAKASALVPPLHKECASILLMGIPLFVGYCSMTVAIFSALLMSSTVTLCFLPSCQYPDMKVLFFALWCLEKISASQSPNRAIVCVPVCFLVHTHPFQAIFLVVKLKGTPSAIHMRLSGAERDRHCNCPQAFFLKKRMLAYLNCTVCLVLLQVPFVVYSPTHSR
jgi:hypothetical protein